MDSLQFSDDERPSGCAPGALLALRDAPRVRLTVPQEHIIGLINEDVPPRRLPILHHVLRAPFVNDKDIAFMRALQTLLIQDEILYSRVGDIFRFLDESHKIFRNAIIGLISLANATDGNVSEDTIAHVGTATLRYLKEVRSLKSLLDSSTLSESNGDPALSCIQEMLKRVSILLGHIEQRFNALQLSDVPKCDGKEENGDVTQFSRFFRAIPTRLKSLFQPPTTYTASDGEKYSGYTAFLPLQTDVANLLISFDGDMFFQDNRRSLHWLKVIWTLASYQKRLASVMSEASPSPEGGIAAENLFSPRVILKKKFGKRDGEMTEDVVAQDKIEILPEHRLIVITGPNSGGKTELAQSIADLFVHNQIGSKVLGQNVKLPIVDKILAHRTNTDSTDPSGRLESELEELAKIRDEAGPRSLVIIDEMLLGTQQSEIVDRGAVSIIDLLVAKGARVIFITHQFSVLANLEKRPDTLVLRTESNEDGSPSYQFNPTAQGFSESEMSRYHEHVRDLFNENGFPLN